MKIEAKKLDKPSDANEYVFVNIIWEKTTPYILQFNFQAALKSPHIAREEN